MNLFKREIQIPIMLKSKLQKEMSKLIASSDNSADKIISICESFYNKPVSNLQDMKNRNLKSKGDIFEEFCVLYMKQCYKLKDVWLLNDVPSEIRKNLNLEKKDFGIDVIGIDSKNRYYAIQVKYRKRKSDKKISVTWKQLSTFYALCARTGPFHKHIIFTTANYVRRIGKKDNKDETIGFTKLKKINHFDWIKMSENFKEKNEESIVFHNKSIENRKLTIDELRQKRIEYFSN
tara:strand:- start:183 stop:884 length:702 start_codon:yes stop_codon:yes gene_type:complete